MKNVYGPIGSVSHGSLLMEDLIPASTSALESIRDRLVELNDAATAKEVGEIDDLLGRAERVDNEDSQEEQDIYEELCNKLNEYAAPYCSFGMHPGDGSDLGFWFDLDAFDQAVEDGEVVKVDDISGWEEQPVMGHEDVDYVAQVSDHGNVTLYYFDEAEKKLIEVYSIV